MQHAKLIETHRKQFERANILKYVQDISMLLSHPLFHVDAPAPAWSFVDKQVVEEKEKLTALFRRACIFAGVLARPATPASPLAEFLQDLPRTSPAPELPALSGRMHIVVADDRANYMLTSVMPLLGWRGVRFSFVHYCGPLEPPDPDTHVQDLADRIQALHPDVVLMDQHFAKGVQGSDIVTRIREAHNAQDAWITFIGNTGGAMKEFKRVLVRTNHDKGRRWSATVRAITNIP